MNITTPNNEPTSNINHLDDVIIGVMTNTEFEDRILDTKNYRKASVRGVISNKDKKIAIIYSPKENYYKLPGGGIEDGEKNEVAMKREGKEETGADILVGTYIGTIVEQSKAAKVIQYNRGFLAEVVGNIGETELTEEETERKFTLLRLNIDEAIERMTKNSPTSYRGHFMQTRDLSFLKKAKTIISS